jgi:alkanesulfonate monooxygenase SsuD/methylene tetrahydromethanopterin reductase-like flavin-dependent oxidoreductase (luciferase family)
MEKQATDRTGGDHRWTARNKSASYNGEYYHIEGATMAPGPVQRPHSPITIAAHIKASLEIAARYADT